jgi:hypothetical protein
MPFSENIKLEVKRKAAFRCCRCQSIGIDVHHIVPEKDSGSSDISNAAPLCQNCHDQFGDNPQKRKEIIQMRDWWYEMCSRKYSGQGPIGVETLGQIDAKLEDIRAGQEGIVELKQMLKGLSDRYIETLTAGTATVVASGIVHATTDNEFDGSVYSHYRCKNCGVAIDMLVGTNKCPNCGADLY